VDEITGFFNGTPVTQVSRFYCSAVFLPALLPEPPKSPSFQANFYTEKDETFYCNSPLDWYNKKSVIKPA
jgi:hypothetical protein